MLSRAGLRTTLLTRTTEQAERLQADGENARYLPGVALPDRLRVRAFPGRAFDRADLIFLAVPSSGIAAAVTGLAKAGVPSGAGIVSLTKGLVPPAGTPPSVTLARSFGSGRIAVIGGPAHAREMVDGGAGLLCASSSPELAERVAEVFRRGRVVCEASSDPVGVELAGCAKNAAALAAGATESQGLNAAGMAAADIFTEVLALAERDGGRARTFVGRAGVGDLVATALAPRSRNRSAGELLADGVPAAEIPMRLGQAVEALETVPLLRRALADAGRPAPIVSALASLIDGTLPLERWVELVRVSQPEAEPRRVRRLRAWWRRLLDRLRGRPPERRLYAPAGEPGAGS